MAFKNLHESVYNEHENMHAISETSSRSVKHDGVFTNEI